MLFIITIGNVVKPYKIPIKTFKITANFATRWLSHDTLADEWWVPENIAVDTRCKTDIEAAHLAEVHRVAVAEEKRILCSGRGADVRARNSVTTCWPRHEHIDHVKFSLRVLPLTALSETECKKLRGLRWIPIRRQLGTAKRVSRLRWKECKFGCYTTRTRRTAEQAAQFFEWQSIHYRLRQYTTI